MPGSHWEANKRRADHHAKVLINTLVKFGKINMYKSRYYIDTGYWLRCHIGYGVLLNYYIIEYYGLNNIINLICIEFWVWRPEF